MAKRMNQNLPEGLNGDEWDRLVADIRGHLWNSGDWGILAAKANVNPQTISKLAYGETKSPHFFTIFKIMVALGKKDRFMRLFETNDPVFESEAKKLKPKTKWARRPERKRPHLKRDRR